MKRDGRNAGVFRSVRSRSLRAAAGIGMLGVGALAFGGCWIWSRTRPDQCRVPPRSDLTIEEMISVKRRVEQHENDSSGWLALNGREASFLLADNLEYPVRLDVAGDEVAAELAFPEPGTDRCYNVDFRGKVEVHEGVAHVVPSHLVIGHLDVSRWFSGRSLEVGRDLLTGDHARLLLGSTRELKVVDGHLEVRIDDLRSLR